MSISESLAQADPFFVVFFAALGLAFGSFGNVLLIRFAENEAIGGRSHCRKCRHTLAWYDLIPIISFFLLYGKCRYCHRSISWQYPSVELSSMALFIVGYILFPFDYVLAGSTAVVLWSLLLISIYDARSQLIPDLFTAMLFISSAVYAIANWSVVSGGFGALLAGGCFALQWLIGRGRYVGSGDILLAASLGLWLGLRGTIVMLFLSYIIGAVFATALIVSGKASRKSHIAFAPFLALGGVLAFLGVGDFYTDIFFP